MEHRACHAEKEAVGPHCFLGISAVPHRPVQRLNFQAGTSQRIARYRRVPVTLHYKR